MATPRKLKKTKPESEATQLTGRKELFEQALNERIQIGEEMLDRQIQKREQFDEAEQNNADWNSYNSELLKQSFNNDCNESKKSCDDVNFYYRLMGSSTRSELVELKEKLQNKLTSLNQLLAKVDLINSQVSEGMQTVSPAPIADTANSNNVFIVHGHNNELKDKVAQTLEKLGLSPIILNEHNDSKTVIEKLEKYSDIGFAIILLTDEDFGKAKNEDNLNLRTSQNVILEMGYLIGRLGRERVYPLYTKGVELLTDFYGLLYTEIDTSENWKIKMAIELNAAGYEIDVNKII